MSRRFVRILLAAQALGACATVANAGTLFTAGGFTPPNGYTYCLLSNIGTTTAQVTTNAVIQASSGIEVSQITTCSGTLQPGTSCWTYYNAGNSVDTVYCRFVTSTSKVRGSLSVLDANAQAVVTLPATK
jgi:hypothetical protein